MRVEFSNLRLLKEDTVKKPIRKSTRTVKTDVSRTASTEVDVRGQTAMEAVMSVDNAIDSAILMNLNTLTIIHGKGTGVLRKEIQAHLKKHPQSVHTVLEHMARRCRRYYCGVEVALKFMLVILYWIWYLGRDDEH